jgi:ribonucleoside-diphosphate reductase beta chain
MESIGIPSTFGRRPNPLPWTQKWISGKEVQVSPQEVELSSYRIGDAKMDVTDKTFSGMTL